MSKFRTIVFSKEGTPTCGQACVATILGISLDEAIERVGHSNKTKYYELLLAMGMKPKRSKKGNPSGNIIALQIHRNATRTFAHWTIYWMGVTLNPSRNEKGLYPVDCYYRIPKKIARIR